MDKETEHNEFEKWHLDRRVPLALIFAIFVQTATAFWWASGMSYSLSNAQTAIKTIQDDAKGVAGRLDRMTVLETELKFVNETLRRLETAIDRLGQKNRR